jgi:ADP-ribosyl-[dinitrogen reductase] hydrolase
MLLELAIGDAYGAGFEYVDPQIIHKHNNLTRYLKHPKYNIGSGCYTDDTQMSIAIAEVLVSGNLWTPQILANKFVEVFKRDPRPGYAGRFYNFLEQVRDGEQFLKEIHSDSDKSGAAMRAAPIGVLQTIESVIDKSTTQAKITHNTPDGINAAIAASLTTHYFIYKLGPKTQLGRFLERHVSGRWAEPWQGEVGPKGWMSVRAAITAIIDSDRMSTLLKNCISYTGDVDTVATIALAAGSCCSEIAQDLPLNLIDNLENKQYGRNYLIELDKQLMTIVKI